MCTLFLLERGKGLHDCWERGTVLAKEEPKFVLAKEPPKTWRH